MPDAAETPARRADDPKITEMAARVTGIENRQVEMATEMARNTAITERIERSTSGLVDAWEALSGGLKVLNWLGKIAKWFTVIAGAATAAYAAWTAIHSGVSPVDVPR